MTQAPPAVDFLAAMASASRERASRARASTPYDELRARAADLPPPPALALDASGFDLIAEVKLRSPANGALGSVKDRLDERALLYARAGAAAVSVLTEPTRFDGALAHLQTVAKALVPLRVPAMRKDFLVDPYQVLEARVAGAGGVLVIVRMLPRAELDALLAAAHELGLFVLLEAFDAHDLGIAQEIVARDAGRTQLLVGVNCRDLTTLKIVPRRLFELAALLPAGVPRVAESGVTLPEQARHLAEAGYDLALVGSAVMTADEPGAVVATMLAAARSAARLRGPACGSRSAG
jgi:indole-3-glycerol phosphate synthase